MAYSEQGVVTMDSWDIRQKILMNQGYAPILGNFDPTRGQQTAAALPDASSTWSSTYPATTEAPAATTATTSYRYSPRTSTGSRNRYAELMAQYQEAQPFSFTGYPSSYTGGYDVAQPQTYAAPVNRYQEIMAQSARAGGRRGTPEAPSAWSQMTPAERAAYYAANPTEGKLALGAQDALGWTTLGGIVKLVGKDGWYDSRLEKMGVNPTISVDTQGILAGTSMQKALNALNPSGGFVSTPETQAVQNAINNTDFSGMDRGSISAAPSTPDTQAVQNAINNTDFSGMDRGGSQGGGGGGDGPNGPAGRGDPGGDRGGWGRGGGYAQGGHVSMQHLQGPDPEGPDDGYAALKDGEFVINDKAVKKYGIELMNAINSGKISKGKLRGLLEM